MIPVRSDVLDYDDEEQASSRRQAPTMVSLHFVRSALRRRWLICVLSAVLGMLAASTFLVAFPVVHNARASLRLAHDPETDLSRAMATDVSLLKTRTVASRTVERLGLTMTPDDFLKSVTAVSVSSELLELKLTAPSNAEAVRRLSALTSVYLQFRSDQLSAQSEALITGMQERIRNLEGQVNGLTTRIDDLTKGSGSANTEKLSQAISQRAYVQGRIDTLRQSVEDATLQNQAILTSSNVLDPPAAEVGGAKRRIALALASGLIGGAAIGCGTVLFFAIISDRLRRRSDVAEALEVPVPVSVRRITPLPKRLVELPLIGTLDGHRTAERLRLAHAIEMELPEPARSGRLAVLGIDNAEEVRYAVAAAAADLVADGRSVVLLDLTSKGHLDGEMVRSMADSKPGPTVLRPRGLPTLASDAAELRVVGDEDKTAPSLEANDVTLVLADLDPSVGADYLLTWSDRVIIAVTAGRSSAEMVRTAGDLVRSAGLEMRVAALLHTERTDDSSGITGFDRPIQIVEKHDRLTLVGATVPAHEAITGEQTVVDDAEVAAAPEPAAEEEVSPETQQTAVEALATAEEQPAAVVEAQAVADEQPVDEKQLAHEELTASEDTAQDDELSGKVEQATEEEQPVEEQAQLTDEEELADEELLEQLADEEQLITEEVAPEEQPATEEAAAEEQPVTEEEQPATEEAAAEEQPVTEEPAAEEQPLAKEEQPVAEEEQPTTEQDESAVEGQPVDEEPTASERTIQGDELTGEVEQILDDDQTVEMQVVVDLAPAQVDVQAPVDLEPTAVLEQPFEDELAVDDDATVQMAVLDVALADEQVAPVAESPEESEGATAWQIFFLTAPLVHVQPSPEDDELDWTWEWLEEPSAEQDADSVLIVVDDDTEVMVEPDELPQSSVEIDVDGWALYIDVYPPVYLASRPGPEEDDLNWNWDWDWDEEPAATAQESNGHESNGNGHDQNEAQVSGKDQPTQAGHRSSRV
jgi:capsular polysaccharide biosynthesis protein